MQDSILGPLGPATDTEEMSQLLRCLLCPEFNSLGPCKKSGMVGQACNANTGEAETDWFLGFVSLPV